MVKIASKMIGVFMGSVTLLLTGLVLASWGAIVIYSKVFNKDEAVLEKTLEEVVEHNVENALNLPEGTLSGKLDFMVQPIEEDKANKTD